MVPIEIEVKHTLAPLDVTVGARKSRKQNWNVEFIHKFVWKGHLPNISGEKAFSKYLCQPDYLKKNLGY